MRGPLAGPPGGRIVTPRMTASARTPPGWTMVTDRPDDVPVEGPPETDGEAAWIAAAQAGDRAAFARLVEAYWDRLYRWLYQLTRDRHKAEDLTQETFLKVLAALGSFRSGTNFRAWLFRIGHNNFVNLKRAERKNVQSLADDPPGKATTGPEGGAIDREALKIVADAVAKLSEEFRSALLLRVDEQLSFRDVAAALNITEETARWRVFKARQKLMAAVGPGLFGDGEESTGGE
jgi:RNA polymerase sigma-70 factor (ECF subfamily)